MQNFENGHQQPARDNGKFFLLLPFAIGLIFLSFKERSLAVLTWTLIIFGLMPGLCYLAFRRLAPNTWLLWFFGVLFIWFFICFRI